MNKKIILIGGILIFVVGIIYALFEFGIIEEKSKRITQEVVIGEKRKIQIAKNEIVFTDKGYVPSELTVSKGTEIIFTNLTPLFMNPYGSVEGGIDSFDAKTNIQSNQSWKVILNTEGTWTYQDHTNKGKTGTIIVK